MIINSLFLKIDHSKMKNAILIIVLFLFISCNSTRSRSQNTAALTTISTDASQEATKNEKDNVFVIDRASAYSEIITEKNLKELVYELASDKYEGRETGEKGQKLAAQYLADFYKNLHIDAAQGDDDYFQEIPVAYFNNKSQNDSENVIAIIRGSEKPEEYVVITAHYDHLGVKGEEIYNGADDDASGTVAVLEIARAFKKAAKDGYGPKRSIVFLHLTGEERGLLGSKYYTENPIFSLENTIVNLNIDMIGRYDIKHAENPDFVYLIGSDKLSKELHELSEAANKKYTNLQLDYTYNDENDPNRFYYRSDHYNFAKNNIPIIFYFTGVHEDYHRPTDTADKIRYDLLKKRTHLIFYTAWEIANRENKLAIDIK